MALIDEFEKYIRHSHVNNIAKQLVGVQFMDDAGTALKTLYKAAKSEEELIKEGYKPVSRIGLMWIKE